MLVLLKMEKCSFLKRHIQYFGHIILGKGITPVPGKLDSVQLMPKSTTTREINQFLGLVGYYCKFIPRFADLARPLNTLTRKGVEFEWTDICQHSFELLKAKLLESPILVYPDPNLSYVLFTDASKYVWSCVLTQEYSHKIGNKDVKNLHPIMYQSGLFKGSQINWACLTKEAYAIYMSVKKLDYYLVDVRIILCSDHLPLRKFLAKNTLNSKVNNWAIEISPFKIQFEYICRANDKSASVPVCYGRQVTSRTEITCLEDAIRSQRTHTEYRSPIGANDIGRNPASGCAKQFQPIRGSRGCQSGTFQRHHSKNHIKGPAHGVQ